MAKETIDYVDIAEKINSMKRDYPSLRDKPDHYVFSALFIKVAFYKNPEPPLTEHDFDKKIHDGKNDMGIDILLLDPNSERKALIVGQAKFCKTISYEDVLEAMNKMAEGYTELKNGHSERANESLRSSFIDIDDQLDDESKIHFVFYTSAPKNRISAGRIKKKFLERNFIDTDNIEVSILFADDLKKEIKDATDWKSIVDYGKIRIDRAGNRLLYGDNAAIVNVSAFSIKQLYNRHGINLLSLNLRYHITERGRYSVDNAIKNTIEKNPESFWLKNNGITIICDSFEIDGDIVKLTNFSIVNGGQTTYMLSKSEITATNNFYLSCKIIRNTGESKEEKADFSIEIAQAANSQKPITDEDLKANSPEQRSFEQAMRAIGVFYQTKRGQKVPPKQYREAYRKTRLEEVGKLCMAAIFQMPCVSRNAKKQLYRDRHYDYIFNKNQAQVAQICKELLYIDYYFDKTFKLRFKQDNENEEDAETRIHLANKSRTICIAFTALAARYHCGNITDENITTLTSEKSDKKVLCEMLRDLGDMNRLLPIKLYTDAYDAALEKLFALFINIGVRTYKRSKIPATNYFNADRNYYDILSEDWDILKEDIQKIFADV